MKACQLDRYTRGWRGRKYAKRNTNKARRRAARRDPENAGERVRDFTTGYYS